MVYAPGGHSRFASEAFYGITREATGAGFVIAYADSVRMRIPAIIQLGKIPGLIADKWCVDPKRVFFTGHSDGGTVASALAFLEQTRGLALAIAPSAAGIHGKDFESYKRPSPISVMVMHSAGDRLFPVPEYGAAAAAWWAKCNRCNAVANKAGPDGCGTYANCANGVRTLYCEGTGPHTEWPGRNRTILEFFAASARPDKDGASD